jgi:type IV secretion system protein TrbE
MVSLEEIFSKPRKMAQSLADVLPWFGMFSDGVVLCKDGSLLAGFAYAGSDIEGVLDDDINRRIDLLQNALRQLTDRITIYSVQRRSFSAEYPHAEFVNPAAALIDRAWGQKCTEYPNGALEHRLYLGFRYPNKTEAIFEQLRAEIEQSDNALKAIIQVAKRRISESSAVAAVRGQLAEMNDEFTNVLGTFANIVSVSLGFRRLPTDDLLGDLFCMANLASTPGPVRAPARDPHLDCRLAADDVVRQGGLLEFRGPSGSKYCAALSTTGMPPEAYGLHLDQLMGAPCEYTLVQTFRFIDKYAAESAVQKAESFYRTEVKSASVRLFEHLTGIESQKINTGNLALADDAQQALVELTAQDLTFGYYNMTILALGDTAKEAERTADMLGSSLRSNGYVVTRERLGLMSAFLGSLPGNQKTQLRKYLASTANIADLAPIRTISRGEPTHPLFSRVLQREVPAHIRFMTPYGVPYDFNTHAGDLGHAVVVGGSGSGKSSVMSLLIALFQKYFPCQTYVFDKDHSISLLTTLLGGVNLDMANPAKSGQRCNPVRRMLGDGDQQALRKWIGVLYGSGGHRLTPEQTETINSVIQQVQGLGEAHWTLGIIYATLAGKDKDLALLISPYVDRSHDAGSYAKGAYSEFFDNEEDNFDLQSIVCMETGKLLQTPEIAAPFMDYAFYCIEKKLDSKTPTLIYVEEAWYMLANPTFEEKIDDWLRTFRKKRAYVVFATQSPDEFTRLRAWAAFVANVPTQIFLPSINDSVAATGDIYRKLFALNDAQLGLLAQAVPRRDYLIVKPGMTRLVQAQMPEIIIAINEATARADYRERAAEMAATRSQNWQFEFLKEVLHVEADI